MHARRIAIPAALGIALMPVVGLAACGGDDAAQVTVTVTEGVTAAPPGSTETGPDGEGGATTEVEPDADTTAPGEAEVDRPADFPTLGEEILLERLGGDVTRFCTRESDDDRSDASIAGIECDLRATQGVSAFYELFSTRAAMLASTTPSAARTTSPWGRAGARTPRAATRRRFRRRTHGSFAKTRTSTRAD